MFWKRCEKEYRPAQILIEYNGMWEMEKLFKSGIPGEWFIGGVYSTVNAETAELPVPSTAALMSCSSTMPNTK